MTKREVLLDNVKGVCIFVIVLAYVLTALQWRYFGLRTVMLFSFSFYMFLFAFVSGYFSKKYIYKFPKIEVAMRLLGLYVVFYYLFFLFSEYTPFLDEIRPNEVDIFYPYGVLWYLVSLVSWRYLLPVVSRVRYFIFYSFIVAVLFQFHVGDALVLSYGKTLTFLPFFLVGAMTGRQDLQKLRKFVDWKVAVGTLLVTLGAFAFVSYRTWIDYAPWLAGTHGFEALKISDWRAPAMRTGLLLMAVVTSMAVLVLIPEKKSLVTRWGENSLKIFLVHMFIVHIYVYITSDLGITSGVELVLAVPITFLICMLLSVRVKIPQIKWRLAGPF